ncbi:MAG: cysteine desulfurase family protein [Clostridium perfringens]|nr:cysteine desulfurase family protein [Clostridium perfringens]
MEVYFDNSATTKPSEEVVEVMKNAMMNYYGNPSSLHSLGLKCQNKLMEAKNNIAEKIGAVKEEIFFTSGGSESNNMILKNFAKEGSHIVTTKFEHASVLNTLKDLEKKGVLVTYLSVNEFGFIDLKELEEAITKNTVLVSIMQVNNEIGSIQNLKEIGKIIKEKSQRARFHVDGVQGFGKIKVDVKKCNIDFYSASAHKIHGPKGVGFCYVRKSLKVNPLIEGGGQESGVRAGTENLPGVLSFVKASDLAFELIDENYKKVLDLKKYFIERLEEIKDIKVNSPLLDSISPYILNVSFFGVRAEVLLHMLEEKGIFVSTGSACSSKSAGTKGSHVLNAIGLKEKCIQGAIRFSFSKYNTKEEIDYTIENLQKSLKFLRRIKI